eukprot:CAMPEP_0184480964 /NCGR_PEP_ID=MMETSP0113_2-20130426/2507_1 /TAXON_ID=91329 /ORGANISM="Norrisiella sphaerica, Strain BC52" /LENGTH=268 /DNA_ID=CAMNT_0026859805 /DNA_START=34 /DNA_END=840 /DNA_ORIENTATION=-
MKRIFNTRQRYLAIPTASLSSSKIPFHTNPSASVAPPVHASGIVSISFSTLSTSMVANCREEKVEGTAGAMGDISDEKVSAGYYHKILGVSPGAGKEAIRSAYHTKLFEVHPDHGGSAEMFLEVREAFQALTAGKDLFALTRGFCDSVWASQWDKAERLWEDLLIQVQESGQRFGALFFDDILHACRRRGDYVFIERCVHSVQDRGLFEGIECRNVAYDSLLWHLSEGNRLSKPQCDIHLVHDCLHEMHNRQIPIMEEGWYITYSYES